jgi:deoxyguanosine kinase
VSKFIVIEGLIGVGKTSLCRIMAEETGAHLVLEPAENNPFLANFYSDPLRFAFPAQMFYLASRCKQQNRLMQTSLFSRLYISDYLFAKDRLFAEQTLDGEELDLYYKFGDLLSQSVATPDFVLFLDAPTEVVLNRIKKRAIQAEQVIEAEYLDDLRRRYYNLWSEYTAAPVYVLDTTMINYIGSDQDRKYMLSMIEGWLKGEPIEGAPEPYSGEMSTQVPLFKIM